MNASLKKLLTLSAAAVVASAWSSCSFSTQASDETSDAQYSHIAQIDDEGAVVAAEDITSIVGGIADLQDGATLLKQTGEYSRSVSWQPWTLVGEWYVRTGTLLATSPRGDLSWTGIDSVRFVDSSGAVLTQRPFDRRGSAAARRHVERKRQGSEGGQIEHQRSRALEIDWNSENRGYTLNGTGSQSHIFVDRDGVERINFSGSETLERVVVRDEQSNTRIISGTITYQSSRKRIVIDAQSGELVETKKDIERDRSWTRTVEIEQ